MNKDIQILNSIIKHLETSEQIDFVGIRRDMTKSTSHDLWFGNSKYKIIVEFLKENGPCEATKGVKSS